MRPFFLFLSHTQARHAAKKALNFAYHFWLVVWCLIFFQLFRRESWTIQSSVYDLCCFFLPIFGAVFCCFSIILFIFIRRNFFVLLSSFFFVCFLWFLLHIFFSYGYILVTDQSEHSTWNSLNHVIHEHT